MRITSTQKSILSLFCIFNVATYMCGGIYCGNEKFSIVSTGIVIEREIFN